MLFVAYIAVGVTSTCRPAQEVRLDKGSTYRVGGNAVGALHPCQKFLEPPTEGEKTIINNDH